MSNDYINICGKSSQRDLPTCLSNYPYSEIIKTFKLDIPSYKSDIEKILQVSIEASIKKYHMLCALKWNKLVMYGIIHVKVIYISTISCESIRSAEFDIPFSTFKIISENINQDIKFETFIEDVFIEQINKKQFIISTLIFIYPIFIEKENNKNDNKKNKLSCENVDFDKGYEKTNEVSINKAYKDNDVNSTESKNTINQDLNYNSTVNKENDKDDHIYLNNYLGSLNIEYDMNNKNKFDIKCNIEEYNTDEFKEEYFESEWE